MTRPAGCDSFQSVDFVRNEEVVGSNPITSTLKTACYRAVFAISGDLLSRATRFAKTHDSSSADMLERPTFSASHGRALPPRR